MRTAESGDMSCGVRQRTLRQVLEYFPQSTVRYCGGRDSQFGIAYASRGCRFWSFLVVSVSVSADLQSAAYKYQGL